MGILKRVIPIFLVLFYCISSVAAAELIPGGQVIGLQLDDGSVYIAGFDTGSCAEKAGLRTGDRIITAGGKAVRCPEDLRQALQRSNGELELTVLRGGKTKKYQLSPAVTADGPKLGVYLRQGISGLGTVTYYETSGGFGALGHGVMDGSKPTVFEKGTVCGVQLLSVRKGKVGEPGQLLGALQPEISLGTAAKNTAQGIFGTITPPDSPTLSTGDARTGSATIRCTLDEGGVQEYSVEILKLYPQGKDRCRNLLLKVTDRDLLEKTGGIIQGMSGSPIIQDGKLVGAVTHVLVNDPTMGYGIFIENMLDAAA